MQIITHTSAEKSLVKKASFFILSICLFFSALFAPDTLAKDYFNFAQIKLTAPFTITQDPVSGNFLENYGNELILIGEQDGTPQLAMYAFIDEERQYEVVDQISLPKSLFSFDTSDPIQGKAQQFYLLSKDTVWQLKTSPQFSLLKIADVESMYQQHKADYFQPYDFIVDVNNDGLDDIKLQDFNGINIYIQKSEHQYVKQSIAINPIVELFYDRVVYSEQKLFFADMTFDNKDDIIAIGEGQLLVYPQQADGLFGEDPLNIKLNENISAFNWWKARGSDGKNLDQSDLQHRTLRFIRDLNNDGVMDMMVLYAQSSGVLEKRNDYEIYFGQPPKVFDSEPVASNNMGSQPASDAPVDSPIKLVHFASEPDSTLKGEGTLTDLNFVDLNEQQKSVVLTSSFDLSLSQIISALLAGSVEQNVMLFSLNSKGIYRERINKEVDLTFSLSTGKRGSPVIIMTDLNGDNRKEMVLSSGEEALQIYPGNDKNTLVESSPQMVKLALPKDGRLISTHDINDDGRFELVIRYNSDDEGFDGSQLLIFKLD